MQALPGWECVPYYKHRKNMEIISMRWFTFLFIALLSCPLLVQAQAPAASPMIAVIDAQRVVQNSDMGKQALAEIKALRDKKQQEIDQRQSSIQQMQDKVEKQKDILSAEAKEKLNGDITKAVKDLRRFQEDSENEIQSRLGSAIKNIEQRVLPIIQKLGNERGYSIIVSKDQLIFFNSKNDITEDVIRMFNEAMKSGQQPKKP
jgi:outer membrane protein